MLISYRGHFGEKDPWQTQGGLATEPLLHALHIPIWHLTSPGDVQRRIKDAQTLAHAHCTRSPFSISRELMWED